MVTIIQILFQILYISLYLPNLKIQKTIMIGEDIEGEYGGAFKVTKDLSIKFPNRVRNARLLLLE